MKPRLLDLFCGAGGAALGYHRAGFEVIGVDVKPQPRYPFEFVEGDAFSWDNFASFDAGSAAPFRSGGGATPAALGPDACVSKVCALVAHTRALPVVSRPFPWLPAIPCTWALPGQFGNQREA